MGVVGIGFACRLICLFGKFLLIEQNNINPNRFYVGVILCFLRIKFVCQRTVEDVDPYKGSLTSL